MSFGERLELIRRTVGSAGRGTSVRALAKEGGFNYRSWNAWEREGMSPRGGLAQLAETLARLPGVRERSLDPGKLAAWAWTGEGEPPFGGGAGAGSAIPAVPSVSAIPGNVSAYVRKLVRDAVAGHIDAELASVLIENLFAVPRVAVAARAPSSLENSSLSLPRRRAA